MALVSMNKYNDLLMCRQQQCGTPKKSMFIIHEIRRVLADGKYTFAQKWGQRSVARECLSYKQIAGDRTHPSMLNLAIL